jgi:hypothetical protein
MKQLLFPFICVIVMLFFAACDPENVIGDKHTIDTDTLDYQWDSTKVVTIHLSSTITTSDAKKAVVSGSIITINSKGTYEISGTLTDGQIIVEAEGIVRLILKNASISNSTTSPIFIKAAGKAIIILPDETENTITDGSNYVVTEDSLNATIYSKDYLAFYGDGELTVNGNYNGAIHSKDELIFESGNYQINAAGFGIKGKDYLLINNGTFEINSIGDGLKSDNDSAATNLGFVKINNGSFSITSNSDAISAVQDVFLKNGDYNITTGGGYSIEAGTTSTKGIKGKNITIDGGTYNISSSDNSIDATNQLTINGASFTLYSANKPIESDSSIIINDGTISILKAVKGISSYKIYINGGAISVISTNDCLKGTLGADLTTNDGSYIEINGGTLALTTSKGDALDSNGSVKINGGTVVIQGSATSPDAAISYRNTFTIAGGKLVASGAATMPPGSATTQNSVLIRFSSILIPGVCVNIQDSNGNSLMTYKIGKYAYYLLVSLPTFLIGTTYNVYMGGSVTGTDFNGYYTDEIYTIGTKKGSFTLNATITSVVL